MIFPYQCQKCNKRIELEFPIGKAPRQVDCDKCKGKANRVYEGMSIAVKINGSFCGTTNFGEQMKAKNIKAGEKMKGKKPGLKLAAYDYGGGDVREVKK